MTANTTRPQLNSWLASLQFSPKSLLIKHSDIYCPQQWIVKLLIKDKWVPVWECIFHFPWGLCFELGLDWKIQPRQGDFKKWNTRTKWENEAEDLFKHKKGPIWQQSCAETFQTTSTYKTNLMYLTLKSGLSKEHFSEAIVFSKQRFLKKAHLKHTAFHFRMS